MVRVSKHFLKTSDGDVESYLKMFTLLPLEQIQEVMESHNVRRLVFANPGIYSRRDRRSLKSVQLSSS
jgi:tyrosyl-tRNA synthetase